MLRFRVSVNCMDKTLLCRCKDWDGYGFLNYWMKVLLKAEKCICIIPFHAGKGMLEKWGGEMSGM